MLALFVQLFPPKEKRGREMNRKSLVSLVPLSLFLFAVAGPGKTAHAQEPVSTDNPSSGSAVLQIEELHSAFRMSPAQVEQAIQLGQQMAQRKKKLADVLNINGQKPIGVRGERGKSHESLVVCYSLNGLDFVLDAFNATTNYEPIKIPEEIRRNGTYGTVLRFGVTLVSEPKLGTNGFDRSRYAQKGDVKVTRFAVTDDRGHIISPLETKVVESTSGSTFFAGYDVIPHTVTGSSTSTTYASAYGSDGSSARGRASSYSNTTATYNEYKLWTDSYPYYTAQYQVSFPLFSPDGKPLITAATKSLVLHMVTETGERAVLYKLPKPKK